MIRDPSLGKTMGSVYVHSTVRCRSDASSTQYSPRPSPFLGKAHTCATVSAANSDESIYDLVDVLMLVPSSMPYTEVR